MGISIGTCGCAAPAAQTEPEDGMLYPMYVLPIDAFLLQTDGPPLAHQELMRQGLLRQHKPGAFAIFLSHQWVSSKHVDPKGHQLRAFREVIIRILDGSLVPETPAILEVREGRPIPGPSKGDLKRMRKGGIWYDWWSVPQIGVRDADTASASKDMLNAVESIPAYVQNSDLFVALVPLITHEDTVKCAMKNHGRVAAGAGWSTIARCCARRPAFQQSLSSQRARRITPTLKTGLPTSLAAATSRWRTTRPKWYYR